MKKFQLIEHCIFSSWLLHNAYGTSSWETHITVVVYELPLRTGVISSKIIRVTDFSFRQNFAEWTQRFHYCVNSLSLHILQWCNFRCLKISFLNSSVNNCNFENFKNFSFINWRLLVTLDSVEGMRFVFDTNKIDRSNLFYSLFF